MRIHFVWWALAAALCMSGCSREKIAEQVSPMGDHVSVGPITYSVFEASWKDDLPGSTGRRIPKNRFLVIRLTVTNGGSKDFSLPMLRLEGSDGKTYMEEDTGEGVESWLGLIRVISATQTADGRILFDVPPGTYKLQVVDDGDLENQKVRYVEIPFNVEPTVKVPVPGQQ